MLRAAIHSFGARGAVQASRTPIQSLAAQGFPRFNPTAVQTSWQRSISNTTRARTARKPPPALSSSIQYRSARVRSKYQAIIQRLRSRFYHGTRARLSGGKGGASSPSPNPTPQLGSPRDASVLEPEPTTLGAKMRKLSREYGWSALGVYMMLTAIDLPLCYLLVGYLGTDRIGRWEHIILSHLKAMVPESVKQTWHDWRESMKKAEEDMASDDINSDIEMAGWGVAEAEEANQSEAASIATKFALAYAIHKSFIFIRVPLTIALTPKLVRVLRGWGWDIGKRTTKEAKALRRASLPPKKQRRLRRQAKANNSTN